MINHEIDSGEFMLLDYMDKIKEEAKKKLTNLELAALYNDFEDFKIRYREEMIENYCSTHFEDV